MTCVNMANKCVSLALIAQFSFVLISSAIFVASGQDILRQRLSPQSQSQPHPQTQIQSQPQQTNNNQNVPDLSSFADIKLPPQLASLSPEQLLQLAKIRELQIRQQQQQQQLQRQQQKQQTNNRQATPRPSLTNNGQIPQPSSAQPIAPATPATPAIASNSQSTTSQTASQNSNNNKNVEDGSYKESESEMEGVVRPENDGAPANQAAAPSAADHNSAVPTSNAQQAPSFEVNWNKCPQLEPSESEKGKKTQVITKCLQNAPIPTNLTRENVESHREQIATCALKVEGWFDDQGNYKYDKAEAEIKAKRLESQIELQVLKFHVACKGEAQNKFPRQQHKLIEQVQFYQACMDYYISIVCEIEVSVDQ